MNGPLATHLKLKFGYTYSKLIEAMKKGGLVKLVSLPVFNERIEECKKCKFLFEETNQCKLCGCNVFTKASVSHDPFTNEVIKCDNRWKN